MKNKHKTFPFIFLIFGIVLISGISGLSIRKYVKSDNSIKEKSQQASIESDKEKNKNSSETFLINLKTCHHKIQLRYIKRKEY
ncbi:hypothetical protein [Clostridium sp. OS1-26]|uniref:hypothetical protein n=1 Tax=Clostridium sp. OS1-26 TaxID=3070681 RepID=UPI0027DF4A9E|nr:hypothetical protein [Clostridium sp. OS1-26]WML37163.1 hypothetical protein RCG18_11405 [Clostridium sp. OS1-26]